MTRAVILAAGRGSRLMPYTENCPKCLTEVGGKSLIGHQLATLDACGIDDIVIVTGYQAERLALPGTRQRHNDAWADTNMVESLFCAEDIFGDDMLVCYSDIVYSQAVLRSLLASDADVGVVIDRDWLTQWSNRFEDPLSDAESLVLAPDGRILDIGNKVDTLDLIHAQYIGLMRFRGAGIEALKAARANWNSTVRPWMSKRPVRKAYMTDLLMEMILMDVAVHGVPIDGGWFEVDQPGDLAYAGTALTGFAENIQGDR